MNPAENIAMQGYIAEKWWHRLLKVFLYGSTVLVLVIIGLIQFDSASYYTYSYSFENSFERIEGSEQECAVYEYSRDVSCGDLTNSGRFIEKYLVQNGHRQAKEGNRTLREAAVMAYKEGISEFDLASHIIKRDKVRYKMQKHYDSQKIVSGIGRTTGAAAIWFVIGLLGYKLLLYIVHGHTRVKKGPLPRS